MHYFIVFDIDDVPEENLCVIAGGCYYSWRYHVKLYSPVIFSTDASAFYIYHFKIIPYICIQMKDDNNRLLMHMFAIGGALEDSTKPILSRHDAF